MSTTSPLRRAVLGLALVQPFASLFHQVTGLGQSVQGFAGQGDEVLKAAGYAFAIWGVIYAACMAYGVYQAWPRRTPSALEARLGWPSAVAFAACTAWVIVAELDLKAATVVIILIGALSLILPLLAIGPSLSRVQGRQRWLVAWPLAALAGWLTVASAINVVTYLTATGYLDDPHAAALAGYGALGAASIVALGVLLRTGLLAYTVTFVWGLIAVVVAEADRGPGFAILAAVAALVIAACAATRWRARALR